MPKKSKNLNEKGKQKQSNMKERKQKGKKKDNKERKEKAKIERKKTNKERLIETANSFFANILSFLSICFIGISMYVGIINIYKAESYESILSGLICAVFIVIGTWFNEKI